MSLHATSMGVVMTICLIASGKIYSGEEDVHRWAKLGSEMSSADKTSLEERVEKYPDDVESRTKLLGYYFIKGRREAGTTSARRRHIVWLIENAPESEIIGLPYGQLSKILDPEGYDRARQAWLKTIEKSPENLSLLRNASSFLLLYDRKISEELLLKGQALDAKDPQWPASLGRLYSLGLTSLHPGSARKSAAEKAFHQYELAYKFSDAEERKILLDDLAKTAFEAGLFDDAKKFAEEMLHDQTAGWNRGNQIHHGNLILGRIALVSGNVDEAKSRLLLAGKTKGSPQLNSFGPNMQLAKELLERGETEVVLEYFELCKKFWTSSNRKLENWENDVKSNHVPQFGGNLAY